MKCDDCKFYTVSPACANPEYAQPYDEQYCTKGHWEGLGCPEDEVPEDAWADCEDYVQESNDL